LKGKEAISGWRHVRRAARDDMDDVPVAFFMSYRKLWKGIKDQLYLKWAIHLSSIAISVGRLSTSTVVLQG
jgi:hypothetical protein